MGPVGAFSLCSAISAGIALTPGAAAAPAAFSVCETALNGALATCAAYDIAGGGVPPGAPNLFDEACNALADGAGFVEDLIFLEEVTVRAEAVLPTGDFVSGSSTFQPEAGQSGPDIVLVGPGLPELVSFEAIPFDPVECQSYTAFANVICETDSTVVQMSISGTDGYQDSVVCSGSCQLAVPGAGAGVVDTITVTINADNTGEITDVIGLFFRSAGGGGGCGGSR